MLSRFGIRHLATAGLLVGLLVFSPRAHGQRGDKLPPLPKLEEVAPETNQNLEKISLNEAVRRALARNPTAIVAFQEIKRAEALVVEARAPSMPSLMATATLTRLDSDRLLAQKDTATGKVNYATISAANQESGSLLLNVPLISPRAWTQWSESAVGLQSTKASNEDMRRTLATTTARAYLAIISLKRQVDITARAVANDRSHYDYTHTRYEGGVGNRVDEVRAAQQLAADQALLSSSFNALARAREALGVLLGEDRPVDTFDDVNLADGSPNPDDAAARRQDVVAAKTRTTAAEKIRKDSWTDFSPSLNGQVQPFFQNPKSLTMPTTGWQAFLILSFPIIEGGVRRGQMRERDALLSEAQAQYEGLLRQTKSDIRVAVEEIHRTDEAMRSSGAAADLAHQALDLANLAYHAGATTNIEVIDAERRAHDADSAVVIAEDAVRQARLDLLVAAGQFP